MLRPGIPEHRRSSRRAKNRPQESLLRYRRTAGSIPRPVPERPATHNAQAASRTQRKQDAFLPAQTCPSCLPSRSLASRQQPRTGKPIRRFPQTLPEVQQVQRTVPRRNYSTNRRMKCQGEICAMAADREVSFRLRARRRPGVSNAVLRRVRPQSPREAPNLR